MSRPNDTSDARTSKRRQLNDNSFEECLPYPHVVSSTAPEQHEYADLVDRGEEDTQLDCSPSCQSDVESSAASTEDDGWSECCYGMVGSCIKFCNIILLIAVSSCPTSACDFDFLQTSRSLNCLPTFLSYFEGPTRFPC